MVVLQVHLQLARLWQMSGSVQITQAWAFDLVVVFHDYSSSVSSIHLVVFANYETASTFSVFCSIIG